MIGARDGSYHFLDPKQARPMPKWFLTPEEDAKIQAIFEGNAMRLGCCSAISPCEHQRRDPHTLCHVCQESADRYAESIQDLEIRKAVRLLTSVGYTVAPPQS